jgi:hypothetical protein
VRSGTVQATPSFETFVLVIALATSRVLARSAPGSVQPAAGFPVAATGLLAVTAFPVFVGQAAAALLLLLLLPLQPPTARPAASSRDPLIEVALRFMALAPP